MELIDVLDEKGNKTGKSKPKLEIHRDGDWHRAVHVWVVNSKGEILLQRRGANLVNYPDMWDISAAGHVSAGEDDITSALREAKEELGIDLSPDKLEKIGETKIQAVLNNGTYIDHEYDIIYLVRADFSIDQLKMQASEVKGLRYLSISELKKLISEQGNIVPHVEEYKLLFKALEN